MKFQVHFNKFKELKEADVFLLGDAKDVIFSRAKHSLNLPLIFNGFGACGTKDPETVGESIVFREHIATTIPDHQAGLNINYTTSINSFYTPFFVGWSNNPTFQITFTSKTGITINNLYQHIFSYLRNFDSDAYFDYVFLEIIGLFDLGNIFDRALQKPINEGNILTTLAENADSFFKSRIISNDLTQRNIFIDKQFPLFITGAGHLSENPSSESAIQNKIFYVPPQHRLIDPKQIITEPNLPKVLTHNHALGWLNVNPNFYSSIKDIHQSGNTNDVTVDAFVNELLKERPDYLVHLDDWSVLNAALVSVNIASENKFDVRSTFNG